MATHAGPDGTVVPSTHSPWRVASRHGAICIGRASLLSPVTGENITTDLVADERWSLCAVCLQPHNLDQNQSMTMESRSPSHLAVLLNLDFSFGTSPRPARCQAGASPCSIHKFVGVSCKGGARLHLHRALVRLGTKSERLTIAGSRARQSYAVAIPRVVHRCKARVQDEPTCEVARDLSASGLYWRRLLDAGGPTTSIGSFWSARHCGQR